MKVSDFDFDLPGELIAQAPLPQRDQSRMLVVGGNGGLQDKHISDFVDFLRPDDVVVFNDSRVVPCRFDAEGMEFTLHTKMENGWLALAKKFNKLRIGKKLKLADGTEIEILDNRDDGVLIKFHAENVFEVLERVGKIPLPPYIRRPADETDRARYQTVYANEPGSMAAPTAGLHFTEDLIKEIKKRAKVVNITLHVGAGTWMPVKTEDTKDHKMHLEFGTITPEQAEIINGAGRVVAVGTTTLRLLESAARPISPSPGSTVSPSLRGSGGFAAEGELPKHFHRKLSTACAQSFAKTLRKTMTEYECLLWKNLKKSPNGFSFRKQHPIGNYIVDFINLEHKLIIELDGEGHLENKQIRHDAARDKFLTDSGYGIIRFWNSQIYKNMQNVLDVIYLYLTHGEVPELRDFYPKEIIDASSPVSSPSVASQPLPLKKGETTPRIAAFDGATDIFITPGYKFNTVDVLLTNFHLPKSTLFMLVCAFAGTDEMKKAYAHAMLAKYRFFSYGDCCLLFKQEN
jgi:S-adenosylmethionine:tRNA ribosyltransferase-isomerase